MSKHCTWMTSVLSSALVFAGFAACSGSHETSPVLPETNHQAKSKHADATTTSPPGTMYVRGTAQLISTTGATTITVPAGTAVGDCLIDNHIQIGGTFAAPKNWGTLAGPTASTSTNTTDAVYGHIVVAGDPTSYSWTSSSNPSAIDMMYDVVGCKSAPAAFVSSGATPEPTSTNATAPPELSYYQELNNELGIVFFTQLVGSGSSPAYKSPSPKPAGYTLDVESVARGSSMDGISMFGTSQAAPQITIPGYFGSYQSAGVVLSSATASATASPLAYLAISAGNMNPVGNYRYDFTAPGNGPPGSDIAGGVQTAATSASIDRSGVTNPAPEAVYQHYTNSGSTFTYDIPGLQPSTTYPVRLHFAEIYYNSPNQRSFNVTNAGNVLISNLDPYSAAGGQDKAYAVTVNAVTNAEGHLILVFAHSGNPKSDGPCINGIEINPSAAPATSTPTPAQTTFPVYSNLFTGNTPFHHTVADLINAGAVMRPAVVATNLYGQAAQVFAPYQVNDNSAIYSATASDPAFIFTCPAYKSCADNGATVHCPNIATPAEGPDHHLVCEDSVQAGEIDGEGGCNGGMDPVIPGGSCVNPCNLTPGNTQDESGSANCAYGGFYPYSGGGLGDSVPGGITNGADAAGYAYGLMEITAQELINGKINHALGMVVSCVDDGYFPTTSPSSSPSPDGSSFNGVYPSNHGSDQPCTGQSTAQATAPPILNGGTLAVPNVVYGDLVTIAPYPSVDVTTLGAGKYCVEILQALQTYGAYIADTDGGGGVALEFENPLNAQYASDPWGTVIFPNMVASGDALDSKTTLPGTVDVNLNFRSCLQYIPTGALEVYEISPNLPSQ